ncbi:MAG: hypothetical protein ACLPVO_07910 [Desulfomonilaceae bacterium]
MGIFDRITRWISGKTPAEKPTLGVTVEMVGNDYISPPPKPKRKLIQPDPVCPYCGFKYEVFPKDRKPCPSCGEIVIIKSRDKIKHLLTKTQAEEWENDKKERASTNKAKNYLSMGRVDTEKFPLSAKGTVDEYGLELSSKEKATFKTLVNTALKKSVKKDFDGAFWAYFALAHFLRDNGLDYFETLKLMNQMRLLEMKTKDRHDKDYGWKVQITTGCKCDACKEIDGKVLTLDEALETMPYPSRDCTAKFPFTGRYLWFVGE